MKNQKNNSVPRPATAEERREMQQHRRQVEKDLPELRRQAVRVEREMRESAMLEPTISGQLRRAISDSGTDLRELAAQTMLSPKALAEFLTGAVPLDSQAIDRLAATLKQHLTPIG